MQITEVHELINELINQAELQEHTEQHLITTLAEYRFYLGQQRALKVVIKLLRNCANLVFTDYCKEVMIGEPDFGKILAFSQLRDVAVYYEQEFAIVKEMNDEYDNYLGDWGNFFKALAGHTREVE